MELKIEGKKKKDKRKKKLKAGLVGDQNSTPR